MKWEGNRESDNVEDRMAKFVATVLGDTEDVWKDVFTKGGATYQEPKLVLFRGATATSSCGQGQAAMGPFYCPEDQKVYIDLGFYETLKTRLGAPGDFAQAARQLLEQGDMEEAMNAAARIGDDALQQSSGHEVLPESFTHGTSAQRQRWFDNGLKNGSVKRCDTFSATQL